MGFSSLVFTATERIGHATVCVKVLQPPFGGTNEQFYVSILPEEGIKCGMYQTVFRCNMALLH